MKTKNILIALLFSVVSIVAIYGTLKVLIYENILNSDIFTKIISYWWILLIVVVASFIVYGIYKYIKNRPKEREEKAKDIVDIKPLLNAFKEEFIKETGIPYLVRDDKIIPIHEDKVTIKNTHTFPDKKTGNLFISFEIIALEGNKYGCNFCVLPLFMGLEWVKKNWEYILKENTIEELFNFGDTERPIDVPESENMRIAMYREKKLEEGYEPEELSFLKYNTQKKEPAGVKESEE